MGTSTDAPATTAVAARGKARLAGYAAVIGGAASAVAGAIQAVRTDTGNPVVNQAEHAVLSLVAAALLLWIPGYLAIGRVSGRLGRAGGVLAALGAGVLALGMTSTNLHDRDYDWFPMIAAPANLAWLVGSVLLAVAAYRRRSLPRTLAVALPVVWLTSIILSQLGGNLIAGAVWAVIGWTLIPARPADGAEGRGTP